MLLLAGCGAGADDESTSRSAEDVTCADLASEAVALSEDEGVRLLKVREPEIELDQRSTYQRPSGTEETAILRCLGTGVWSDGTTSNVRLTLKVDADGDAFIGYAETL